jgi:hypothetical protein
VNRVAALKGAGNAIVPEVGAVFVVEFEGAVGGMLPTKDTNGHELNAGSADLGIGGPRKTGRADLGIGGPRVDAKGLAV